MMTISLLPGGLWPVMLTPFEEDGAIDWRGLDALVEWYLQAGSSGLFAVCLSSEMYELTEAERLALGRRVVERAAGRVPVVASGTFGGPLEDQADFIRQMAGTGVRAVVVTPCQLVTAGEGDALLRDRLERLLELTDPIPLGLYECPSPYKRLLSPELMGWAGHTGRFRYHKDTACEPAAIRAKLDAIRNTPLGLYNAHTPTALDSLGHGAAGVSPIAANYYPELFAWLCQHFVDRGIVVRQGCCDDHDCLTQARALQRMLTLMEGVASSKYPAAAKLWLRERCDLPITTRCRVPAEPLVYHDRALLNALWETAEQLRQSLA
jgi:4-hydroxy-tetrahydrodipicolinate synthase